MHMNKLVLALLMAFTVALPAAADQYVEGVQYSELFQRQPVETGDKIEVKELFWYGCPHCFDFEPVLNTWRKSMPTDAAFVRMPAVLRDTWEPHARTYYAFQALGVTDKLHSALFNAIHVEKQKLFDADALADFAAAHGVDRKAFLDAYNSFGVDSEVRKAKLMGRQYEADGVPTIIVDGRYRTTAHMAGGFEQLIKLIDYLVVKAKKERSTK
jgi:thiol:disulfide interchange protein DsbA